MHSGLPALLKRQDRDRQMEDEDDDAEMADYGTDFSDDVDPT